VTTLRPQLDHYIRAFRERDDHPEERQDLGTFLTWLLRRCGYTIRLAPFHYDGPKRRVSKGRYQQGIDLVASRPSEGNDDCEDLFLFVLKPGNVGRSQWRDPKNIIGDLNELKYTKPQEHERWLPQAVDLGRVNIVVVHNGEFDDEMLAGMRRNLQEDIEHFGFGFEWWSAPDLVDKTLTVLGEGPDHELFPPTVRPFYGALLDGLETGGEIAIDAVERLLAARFPCEKQELLRTLTELSVFAAMMTNVPRARSQAVLPLLDMLLALIPRCAAAIVNTGGANEHGISEALADLLASFVDMGSRLAQQLEPLAEIEDGLVFPTVGEQIDWPLRTMWVLRYLALTARTANDLVLLERDGKQASQYVGIAARCLEMSLSLAERNLGAVGTPITDDQLIEYVILWRTWLDSGRLQQTMQTAKELVTRLVLRRHLGLPGPALYQQAKTPITDADARALAEAWFGSRSEASTVFEDGGSTLLPLAIFVALRLGVALAPGTFEAFGILNVDGGRRNMVHPQSWSPPEDASRRWYSEDLRYSGISHIYEFNSELSAPEDFPERFERRQERLDPSPMQMMGFECIDAMAWVHWRTRPPLAWLLGVLPKK
jgi:hypothetical protein